VYAFFACSGSVSASTIFFTIFLFSFKAFSARCFCQFHPYKPFLVFQFFSSFISSVKPPPLLLFLFFSFSMIYFKALLLVNTQAFVCP